MDLICRTCLAFNEDLEPLFCKKLVDTDYNDLTTMISLCTGLEISKDDKLSDTICTQCIESIIAAFKYRKKVWNSNNVLLEASKVFEDAAEHDVKLYDNNISVFNEPYELMIEPEADYIGIEPPVLETQHLQIEAIDASQPELSEITGKQNVIDDLASSDRKVYSDEIRVVKPNHQRNLKYSSKCTQVAHKSVDLQPYSCTICNRSFKLISSLHEHLSTNHNKRLVTKFQCTTCSKTFTYEKYFRRHVNEAHQPKPPRKQNFMCDLCGRKFKFPCHLADHLNRHNGFKPFQCNFCDFRTITASELKLHLRSHTGEKPYVCDLCGIGFKSASHRGAHVKEVHSNGQPYECKICGNIYKSRRVYLAHIKIHNPNHNIECGICHKKFNYRKNLKVHMKQHGEKTFKCIVCEKMFYQKQNCQSHMKKMHNVKM